MSARSKTDGAPDTPDTIGGELRTIAGEARGRLRAERLHGVLVAHAEPAAFLLGVPAVLQLVSVVLGAPLLSTPALIAASVLLPVLWIGLLGTRTAGGAIDDGTAIAEVDRALGLGDRLIAAHEFIHLPERGPFHEAAIADAAPAIATALARGLPERPHAPVGRGAKLRALAATLILLLVASLPAPVDSRGEPGEEPGPIAELPEVEPAGDAGDEPSPPPVEPNLPEARLPRPSEPNPAGTEPGGARSGELSEDVKKTLGQTTSGKSSAAASASGNSQSKGSPSNQSQSSAESPERSKRKPKEPKEGTPREEKGSPPKEPEEMSGSTAGRGAASGSSKSPSASKWASKDQVTSDDEEDLEEDEEVDDEFDNSDARGGVQPNLRDRKPPVNRDLAIGFGNGKNPDANGRGGPSEQKKSRGVAALVLGVPIPDHVKGRPNPGKTKITQERVEPKEEDAPAVAASDRGTRGEGIGHLPRPDLLPWMRTMVERYYAALRSTGGGEPPSGDGNTSSGTPAGSSTEASTER
ncbi:MAG: hypothetical protein ACO4BJ_04155 [Planctomycetota bacterium]|jgi:hypothetical protein